MAIIEYNSDLDVKGRVLATTVPNSTGSIVTWNSSTNVFGLRTNAQIISDLNLSSSFVPYTGATANVNLGTRSITSTGGFVGNATTATTLATARTINGTSFNGSANITTANWGTARNITIGNTTKSVNGSGNVAWSLAEIGAASQSSLNDLGGRNMLLKSNIIPVRTYHVTYSFSIVVDISAPSGSYFRYANFAILGQSPSIYFPAGNTSDYSEDISGRQMVVSMYMRGSSNFSFNDQPVGTTWTKVVFSRIWQTVGNQHLHFSSITPTMTIDIAGIKIEKGNVPTDWTPAPEDQVSDWNETDSTKYSFIKNKPEIPNVTGLVPYTGANQHIDLNTQQLTSGTRFLNNRKSFSIVSSGLGGNANIPGYFKINLTSSAFYGTTFDLTISGGYNSNRDYGIVQMSGFLNSSSIASDQDFIFHTVKGFTGGEVVSNRGFYIEPKQYIDGNGVYYIKVWKRPSHNINIYVDGSIRVGNSDTSYEPNIEFVEDATPVTLYNKPNYLTENQGRYLSNTISDSGFTELFSGDLNTLPNGSYIQAIGGASTNGASGIGIPRSLISFGARNSNDSILQSDILIGTEGFAVRNRSNNIWRTVWHDGNLKNVSQLNNDAGYITSSSLPTVNNGQLTLSTGTGLTGSATFTANQAGSSSFSVAVASTHKLPTTAEWNALSTQTLSNSTSNLIVSNTVQRAALTGDVTASQNSNSTTIANSAVTHAKYQNIATQRILGRGAAGAGNVQELTLGANLSISTAGVLSATNTNTTYSVGNGLTSSGTVFSLGTPSSITAKSTNSVTASSHTHALTGETITFNSAGLTNTLVGFVSGITDSPYPSGSVIGFWNTLHSSITYGAGFFARNNRAWFLTKEKGVIQAWNELAIKSDIKTYTAGTGISLSGTVFGQTITTSGSGGFVTGVTQTANGFQVNLGTPTNTTYSNMSLAEATAGTVTTGRIISAKTINDLAQAKGWNSGILEYSSQGGIQTKDWNSYALGDKSIAVGSVTMANGFAQIAIGTQVSLKGTGTVGSGFTINDEGIYNSLHGAYLYNRADNAVINGLGLRNYQTGHIVTGQYNDFETENYDVSLSLSKPEAVPLFTLGNGTSDLTRSNAFRIYREGSMELYGRGFYREDKRDSSWFTKNNTLADVQYVNEAIASSGSSYTLPIATTSVRGGLRTTTGTTAGYDINASTGIMTMRYASPTQKGMIRVGNGLVIDINGILSTTGGGGGGYVDPIAEVGIQNSKVNTANISWSETLSNNLLGSGEILSNVSIERKNQNTTVNLEYEIVAHDNGVWRPWADILADEGYPGKMDMVPTIFGIVISLGNKHYHDILLKGWVYGMPFSNANTDIYAYINASSSAIEYSDKSMLGMDRPNKKMIGFFPDINTKDSFYFNPWMN